LSLLYPDLTMHGFFNLDPRVLVDIMKSVQTYASKSGTELLTLIKSRFIAVYVSLSSEFK
jgi:hypothetical protein